MAEMAACTVGNTRAARFYEASVGVQAAQIPLRGRKPAQGRLQIDRLAV